ncbi:MAG: histidine phosphatase family protein [Gemmatimonadota bacterium]|nr:histidine phosphatase family protein [Gemmatimonadota bacterium]
MIVFLARHGQSLWNRRKLVTGQHDPALAPEGEAQAQDLAVLLRDVALSAVYASDLSRSRETARVVADEQGREVRQLPALRELHFGTMQGRFRDERDPEVATLWRARKADPLRFCAPGGESFADLITRVRFPVRQILKAHPTGTVLIVGHRNTNRAILATLLGWAPEQAVTAVVRHDCLYRLRMGTPPGVSPIRFSSPRTVEPAVPS